MFYLEVNLLPAIHWNSYIGDYKVTLLNYPIQLSINGFLNFSFSSNRYATLQNILSNSLENVYSSSNLN